MAYTELLIWILLSNLFLYGDLFFGKYNNHHKLPPIILVPGAGGNRLYAKVNNDMKFTDQGCSLKFFKQKFVVWVNLKFLFEPECLAKLLAMEFVNQTNDFFKDGPYANIYTEEFGPTANLEYLTEINTPFFGYYKNLVKKLVRLGYIRGMNLIGAPYDFRKISLESSKNEYFDQITNYTEKLVKFFGQKVIIVSHSLGSPIIKMFFQSKSQSWKNDHIHYWVSVNGVFSGTMNSLKAALVGYNYGLPMSEKKLKVFQRIQSTLPTVYYLMPSKKLYGNNYELVKVGHKIYTYNNISTIFQVKNIPFAQRVSDLTEDIWSELPTGVQTHCIYSDGFPTLKTLVLDSNYEFDSQNQIYTDGDGTIILDSLSYCHKNIPSNNIPTTYEIFHNLNHFKAIQHPRIFDSLNRIIQERLSNT